MSAPPAGRGAAVSVADLQAQAAALHRTHDFAGAVPLWRKVLAAAPTDAQSWCNFGIALLESRHFEEAELALRRALELQPGAPWALEQLGRYLGFTGRAAEALPLYEELLSRAPSDPRLQLEVAYLRLSVGDYAGGWPLYEARQHVGNPAMAGLPMPGQWAGEALAGRKLLIWPEQGYGDQIMAARFVPILKGAGAEVTLVAPPELTALLAPLGVEVMARTADMTLPRPDYWTLPLSIPGRLGVTLENLPNAPYLAAPTDRRGTWEGRVPKGAVGLCWRGNPRHANDAQRSLPNRELLASPLEALGRPVVDLNQVFADFADSAALIEQLELVITVDTAVAHLAGALGKPTWVLLPWLRNDWRWLQQRTDSPWYPSARLFRQPAFGDWDSVVSDVVAQLRRRPMPSAG